METEKFDEELKWGTRQRLRFIEERLFWSGELTRKQLVDEVRISPAQASIDISSYKKLAGENMVYDVSKKAYLLTDSFSPQFISTSPHDFLEGLVGDLSERVSYPFRQIDPNLLRILYRAIKEAGCVTIDYTSMSARGVSSRTIAPHQFLSDGMRWHVRAYDFSSSSFRDFVLGRISFAVATNPVNEADGHNWKPKFDQDWHDRVTLVLKPHPGLTEVQKLAVEIDYHMKDGEARMEVRRACLFYIVSRLRLLDEAEKPAVQQVVLANRIEVEPLLGGLHV